MASRASTTSASSLTPPTGQRSDSTSFKAGVRQFTYAEENGALKLFINGRRFIGRGGNWGFSESNLLYRAREYEAAVRYHRDMGFTMIRNWVGQVGDDAFYEACDRNGVVVWQDFWLANPCDGPNPTTTPCSCRTPRTTSSASATTRPWASTAAATRATRRRSSTRAKGSSASSTPGSATSRTPHSGS